jgi:hypothetical protein
MNKNVVVRTLWMRECVQVQRGGAYGASPRCMCAGERTQSQRGRRKTSAGSATARAVPVCRCLSVSRVCVPVCVCRECVGMRPFSPHPLVVPWGSCLYPTCRIHVRRTRARAQSIAGTRIGASGRACSRTGMHHRPCIVGTPRQASHRHARRQRASEWLATQPAAAAVAAACTYGRGGCTAIPRQRRCD